LHNLPSFTKNQYLWNYYGFWSNLILGVYWKDPKNGRKFFENFADKQGFDPLVAHHWYAVEHTDIEAFQVLFLCSEKNHKKLGDLNLPLSLFYFSLSSVYLYIFIILNSIYFSPFLFVIYRMFLFKYILFSA
jgi:hypothetical protein